MCVGLSAKVVKINDGVAIIDAGGAKREISSQLIEDLEPGDYVMVRRAISPMIQTNIREETQVWRSWQS